MADQSEPSPNSEVSQHFVMPPPPPDDVRKWPKPTATVYPMKPKDELCPGGRLYSGKRNDFKADQHETRVILRWQDNQWVVVRPRLVNPT